MFFFFLNGMTRETAGANSYFSYACCEESREVVIHLTENHKDETAENGPSNIYRRGILAINPRLERFGRDRRVGWDGTDRHWEIGKFEF